MPGASQEPIPPALETLDAELKARHALARAHAVFHMRPSEAHAASVADALSAWRAVVAPPAEGPTRLERLDAAIDRIGDETMTLYTATAAALAELERQVDSDELDHGLWMDRESPRSHDVHVDGHINLTKIVAAALAPVHAELPSSVRTGEGRVGVQRDLSLALATAEVDLATAQGVIAEAPHAVECSGYPFDGYQDCDCWKAQSPADALAADRAKVRDDTLEAAAQAVTFSGIPIPMSPLTSPADRERAVQKWLRDYARSLPAQTEGTTL